MVAILNISVHLGRFLLHIFVQKGHILKRLIERRKLQDVKEIILDVDGVIVGEKLGFNSPNRILKLLIS